MYTITHGARVELRIDVEGHEGFAVRAGARDAGDTVVFLSVDGGEGEGLFEELGVGHPWRSMRVSEVWEEAMAHLPSTVLGSRDTCFSISNGFCASRMGSCWLDILRLC